MQAPKNLPPAAKQAKILSYFQESMSVFTLKELEKNIAIAASMAEAERQIAKEMAKREDDEELLMGGEGMDRKTLLETHGQLVKEMEMLDKELACYSEHDPAGILRKAEEARRLKDSAIRWTDNIEAMESYIGSITGDRDATAGFMAAACGADYVVGEGLKDL
ncbi:meiotic nuclear division protein 1 [Diplocarpon rosae]|nr:meiotic nuclear division protein 1 [Diplocarpon rosae]